MDSYPGGRPSYGMATNPSRDILGEIRTARRMGFDYPELYMEAPEGLPDRFLRSRKGILRLLEGFPHPPVSHTSYLMEFSSEHREVRDAWLRVAKGYVDVASSLGVNVMNRHALIPRAMYALSPRHARRILELDIRGLRELARHASRKGVTIVLENMGPYGIPFRDYRKVIREVPGLKAHLDVCHAFLEGGMPMIRRYIRAFRQDILHIHLADSEGEEDNHIGIGQGVIDFLEVMELLRKIGYSRTITLEVFSSRRDLRDSLRLIRSLEAEVWQ